MQAANPILPDSVDQILARKQTRADAEFDVTAMVDLVSLMNIYFLVTFVGIMSAEINLPAADHCHALDPDTAVVITLVSADDGQSIIVFLYDDKGEKLPPLSDPHEQDERVQAAVERGVSQKNKTAVLIKAEKPVKLRELSRIAAAAAVEGIKLHIAVMEKDVSP